MTRPRSTRTVTVPALPRSGARAERDRQAVLWLGVAVKLLVADAHDHPNAASLRATLSGIERRLAVKHPLSLGRLLGWEAQWLHVGAQGYGPCEVCTLMRRGKPPLRSPFLDRAWANL